MTRLSARRPGFGLTPLLAGVLGLAAAVSVPLVADDPNQDRFDKTFESQGIQKVRIQNVNGPVVVETSDKDAIHVVAVKKAKGSRGEEALKETEIRVGKVGSTLEIETILPKKSTGIWFLFWGGSRPVDVAYEVSLPAGIAVDVETVNGRILASRRGAPLSLAAVNGSVKVEGHAATLRANTVNGAVEVVFAGPFKKSELETVNGSVSVTCSKDSSIRYELQTVNGRIRSEFPDLTVEGKVGPKEARGSINGGRERLAAETVNGEVFLHSADAVISRK